MFPFFLGLYFWNLNQPSTERKSIVSRRCPDAGVGRDHDCDILGYLRRGGWALLRIPIYLWLIPVVACANMGTVGDHFVRASWVGRYDYALEEEAIKSTNLIY